MKKEPGTHKGDRTGVNELLTERKPQDDKRRNEK